MSRLLRHRREGPDRYRSQTYEPLAAQGRRAEQVIAFARDRLVVVAARLGQPGLARPEEGWEGTTVHLPPGEWRSVLDGSATGGGHRPVGPLLGEFPVAVYALGDP